MCLYICECDYVNVYMQHSCNCISYSPRSGSDVIEKGSDNGAYILASGI